MTRARIISCLVSFLFLSVFAQAQTTKVRGRVLDASDGQPVSYAALLFTGSQVGVSADADGFFFLSTRDMSLSTVTVQMLSYETKVIDIKPGAYNEILVIMVPLQNNLSAVTVKADNKKAKRLLENINANKDRNNPELRPSYSCDVYSKMELDLTHPQEQLTSKSIHKHLDFIFDYIDTSEVSGTPYLPIMINETIAKRRHTLNPDIDKEDISASRLSGADPDINLISQFTGSMHLKNNFYKPFLNVFNVEISSPVNADGLLFYNYFIIDSLQVDGRKTYLVRYHPKPAISTPAFDGEMLIDAQDFAIRRIRAKMVKGQNVNWVRDLLIETEYNRVNDSTWFYGKERFYADFSVTTSDSSKLISFIGNRILSYSNPDFSPQSLDTKTYVNVSEDAREKDEEFWNTARPFNLSEKEKNIYKMVDEVQKTKWYENAYTIVYTIINGYWDIGNFGIGPYLKLISYNPLEGVRLRVGAHTSVDWSKKDRFSGYLAYGFRDREFKGGATYEHMFCKNITRKLTIDAHYDTYQMGRGSSEYTTDNIFASLLGGGKSQKLCPVIEFSATYDHEINCGFNTQSQLLLRDYHGNAFVPMFTPSGTAIRNIPSAQFTFQARFSRNETVLRGHFVKTYLHTDFPVFTLNLTGGYSQLGWGKTTPYPFFKPVLAMDWTYRIPPVGVSKLHVDAGTIIGQVPYPLLHLHEGNGTLIFDKTAFSCMNFFEFASDSWVTLMLDHNFYGFFLGKIPFVKKLQMREAVFFKMAWGALREQNDGQTTLGTDSKAPLLFPEGMRSMGNMPYMEAGFGITNILRLFRVDFVWRLTHRDDQRTNPRNFVVNFGIELKF